MYMNMLRERGAICSLNEDVDADGDSQVVADVDEDVL